MKTETRQLLKQETVTGVASTWTISIGVWTVHLCLGKVSRGNFGQGVFPVT